MVITNRVTDLLGDTPLLRIHGLTGPDDAPVLHIVLQKAESLGNWKRIVAVLPDDGMKYLSTDFYDSIQTPLIRGTCLDGSTAESPAESDNILKGV